jgi:hypothetical protein
LGISQRQVYYRALFIQKVIGYPSKGGEKRTLELKINVHREFIGYHPKAGRVSDSVYKSLSGIPQRAVRKEAYI